MASSRQQSSEEEEDEEEADPQLSHSDGSGQHQAAGGHQTGQEAAGPPRAQEKQGHSQRQADQISSGSERAFILQLILTICVQNQD